MSSSLVCEKPYIVWLGPVVNEMTMMSSPAVSPAANRWQRGLLTALNAMGVTTHIIGHVPESMWPKGWLHITATHGQLAPEIAGDLLGYWNLPFLRNRSLSRGYFRALEDWCCVHGKPTAVITYNGSPANVAGATYARKRYGMPWVCIVADDEVPQGADGYVFLSWGYYEAFAGPKPKLHLDGGVSEIRFSPKASGNESPSGRQVVMYTGALTRHQGVDFLVRAFHQVDNPDAELWICGKGSTPVVERLAAINARIKVMGFVAEQELEHLAQQADVFVNPRPSNVPCNKRNFPSKVLEYLSYGKPVISTWTAGLSAEYRDVLIVLEQETEECLASTIQTVLKWDLAQREALTEQIALFVRGHRWSAQASRLILWLDREVWSVRERSL